MFKVQRLRRGGQMMRSEQLHYPDWHGLTWEGCFHSDAARYLQSTSGPSEHHAHRLQLSTERVQHKTERLECDSAKQRLVFGLAKHNWRRGAEAFELKDALTYTALQ